VLDGEIVVLNDEGNPDFQKLQQYDQNRNYPIIYYVFDLLELNGQQLYSLPLIERKQMLADLLPASNIIKYSDHVDEAGVDFFSAVEQKNLEGIMAKRKPANITQVKGLQTG
jgi:bifunctional non-homologous end joining protein LigD